MDDLDIDSKELSISGMFIDLIGELRDLKSSDRTERDRRISVTLTELEKTYAYFKQFVFSVSE